MLIIFPRWFFPNNLGDSIMFTFVPRVLKELGIAKEVHVITHGDLINIVKLDPFVDSVREPQQAELAISPQYLINAAMNESKNSQIRVIYPEWHPNLWKRWNSSFDFFYNHPTLNLISVNYLMQLGFLEEAIKEQVDFRPTLPIFNQKPRNTDPLKIGIVPDTKTANRGVPHPGCDGIGYRFNGPNGLDSWRGVVSKLRSVFSEIQIVEYSRTFLGLGDVHCSEMPFLKLGESVNQLHLGILSDGGMHHVFTAVRTPTVLLGAQRVNKPEFFKTALDYYDSSHYEKCLSHCDIKTLNGWPALTKTCTLDCEKINPSVIADDVISLINKLYYK